jgi:hypothetical protein
MPKLKLGLVLGVLVAACVGATTAGILLFTVHGGFASQILQGVPTDALAAQGISLTEPPADYGPAVSPDQARHAAGFADTPVREVKLAHLNTTKATSVVGARVDRNVWVVNFVPDGLAMPGGPPGSSPNQTRYALAFVDADTGQFIFGFASGVK